MSNILIIDDDIDLLDIIKLSLQRKGHHCITASTSKDAIDEIYTQDIDLCLLDVIMAKPNDGFELFDKLKKIRDIPILFLTSRNTLKDCLYGFELGADDYIYKPFAMEELIARIDARLKTYVQSHNQYKIGNFIIDLKKNQVIYQNNILEFTNHEIKLILFLAKHEGEIFSEAELYRYIWKSDIILNTRTCSVHIANIRKKMMKSFNFTFIQTCWGEGYKFVMPS